MTTNDAEHRGHAETAALKLRGEEGIEDPPARILVHPAAGVADFQAQERTRTLRVTLVPVELAPRNVGPLDRDHHAPSLVPDRLGGVRDEIHDHLANLGSIRIDRGN